MSSNNPLEAYLLAEVESLESLDFVALVPSGQPLEAVQIGRGEAGEFIVAVPGRPPVAPELGIDVRSKLSERGFASQDAANRANPWVRVIPDAAAGVTLGLGLLNEVSALSEKLVASLNELEESSTGLAQQEDLRAEGLFCAATVRPRIAGARKVADRLEQLVDAREWTLPRFDDMLNI